MTITAETKMANLIAGRSTDQLLADLAHLGTLTSTPETRLVGAAISDHITEREGINAHLDDIFADENFDGTYLEALVLALTAKAVAGKKLRAIWTPEDYAQTIADARQHRTY